MLDLKRGTIRDANAVLGAVREILGERPFTVCSQSWQMLTPFHGKDGIRVAHSIGSRRMLAVVGVLLVIGMVFGGYVLAGGKFGIILKALPFELMMIVVSAGFALVIFAGFPSMARPSRKPEL